MRLCPLPRSKGCYYRLRLFQRCHLYLVTILGREIVSPCLRDRCQRAAVHRRLVEAEIRKPGMIIFSYVDRRQSRNNNSCRRNFYEKNLKGELKFKVHYYLRQRRPTSSPPRTATSCSFSLPAPPP